jgi:hypothetical protein
VNTYRAHVYFKACASFDVSVGEGGEDGHAAAKLAAKKWVENLSPDLVDQQVECDDKLVHIEDVRDDIISIDVEEEPYTTEEEEA